MRCSKCGADNRDVAKFCDSCGASLSVESPAIVAKRPSALTGERRYLTVLFCDLVNSTAIATQLDPEEWRELIAEYHRVAAEAIERLGGYVAQYQGDGVLAYFGWPEAHDNNAERPARAGLSIVEAVSKFNRHPTLPELSARIGIDSGAVVVGAGTGKNAEVFGEAPNIANRVQAAAAAGTVLITANTNRLLSGLFTVEDRGTETLKGIERPIQLYKVIQPSGVRGRLDVLTASRGLTPFVGRGNELRLLMDRWELVRQGEGQVISLIGEPGVGKSRLVRRFREQMGQTHTWVEAAAGPFFQNTPFYPVAEILNQLPSYGNEPGQGEEQYSKLAPRQEFALAQVEFTSQLACLRAVGSLDLLKPAEQPLSPHQRRGLLFKIVESVIGASQVAPLVIAIEDLHWADASTLELIELLVEQGKNASLLLLFTCRPEFRPTWPQTQITLKPLSAHDTRIMVEHVAGQRTLTEETVTTVVERTGGVPLFVEELTRAVLESGNTEHAGRSVPATLHDSLMARLDRLGMARDTLQLGAVLGTEFTYELLRAVAPLEDDELQRHLLALTNADLLYPVGVPPTASYQFKHALIREAAYEALLRSRRKELHSRIAEVLERKSPDRVRSEPELLAHHYTEAGLIERAICYWQLAGQRAIERSAYLEAINHFTIGLRLLEITPDSPEHIEQELSLQMARGASLKAIKGFSAPEAGKACARALELCGRLGKTPRLFSALEAVAWFHIGRGELRKAHELAEQSLRIAQNLQTPVLLQAAHFAMGEVLHDLGVLPEAQKHLQEATTLDDPHKEHARTFYDFYGFYDQRMAGLALAALNLWSLGYPDQALNETRESLRSAEELSDPLSRAIALECAAVLYECRREVEATQLHAEALIAISQERGFTLWEALGISLRGWALAKQKREKEGIALIRQGLAATQATGTELWQPYHLVLLAEAFGDARQPEQGLASIAEAFDLASKTGYAVGEPGLYQLKGELLLMRTDSGPGVSEARLPGSFSRRLLANAAQAESCFRRAIEIARNQSAKSRELRATISLARLLASQGRGDEAHSMLADIYNWFTEGFDTADLKEAKALLDDLGR
jgi:class 3 adenylate cyclase/predicted ATPase